MCIKIYQKKKRKVGILNNFTPIFLTKIFIRNIKFCDTNDEFFNSIKKVK